MSDVKDFMMTNLNGASREVDEYIASLPDDVQEVIKNLRKTIKEAAPDAQETLLCRLPTFKLNGHMAQFAVEKEHIIFYPSSSSIERFKDELSKYEGASGAVIFPLNKTIPFDVIKKIVTDKLR